MIEPVSHVLTRALRRESNKQIHFVSTEWDKLEVGIKYFDNITFCIKYLKYNSVIYFLSNM